MLGTGIAITRWRGGASSNGAQSLLSGETDGLALSFLDASAQIKDTTTPANVYNSAGRVSAGALVGPGGKLTYTAPSLKMTRQSDGVYRYQAHNLYLYSELLGATGSSGYTFTGATVTAGQSDSRGGTGAVALVEDGSTNYHRIINPVITTSTGSSGEFIFEAKAGTRSIVAVRWQDSGATNRYSFFNLSAATFVAATADFTGDVTDLGGGWFRCRIACAAQNTTPAISIGGATATTAEGDAVYAGSNGSTALYLGFAHWRRTPSVDSYIATTSAAKYDLPYEWDAAGSALGILVEEARTNLLLNSGIGVTQNVTTSATAYTLSFFGTGTVTLSGTSTDGPLVGTGASDRVSMTFTPTAGTLTLTVSGSCTRCQIEAGSFATSPIETFGSTVTRAADNITLATTTFPWSATAGAVFGVYTVKVLNHAFVSLFANANENIEMFCDVNNHLRVVTGGVVQAAVDAGIVTVNTTARHAGAWAVNDFAAIIDGGTVGTDAAGNLPSAISTLGIGRRASASQQMNGYVKSLMYVPRRMADAELQTLTTP